MTQANTEERVAAATPRLVDEKQDSAWYDLLPKILKLLRREPALGITLGYLLVAMAGIFYDQRFYAQFGIPVLTLSQVGDFLVAGIQQPIALLLVLTTLPICWLFDWFNAFQRRKDRRTIEALGGLEKKSLWQRLRLFWARWSLSTTKRSVTQWSFLLVIVVYGWMFVQFYADYRAEQVRQGKAMRVRLRLNGNEATLAGSKSPVWVYLGAVSTYVFVYDPEAKQALILPTNNIAAITPEKGGDSTRTAPILVPIP